MNSREQAQAIGANQLEAQKRILAEFGGKFAESPAYAFEWSASAFDAAARAEALEMTLRWLSEGATVKRIVETLTQRAWLAAASPPASSSQQANLMGLARMAACVWVLEKVFDCRQPVFVE